MNSRPESNEFFDRLTRTMLRFEPGPDPGAALNRFGLIPFERLEAYWMEQDERLPSALYFHLRWQNRLFFLRRSHADPLRLYYQRNLARNLILERHLAEILKNFSQVGIEVILFKGCSFFSSELQKFRDSAVLGDLDLLVQRSDFHAAEAILQEMGFRLIQGEEFRRVGSVFGRDLKRELRSENNLVQVDLHSLLFWGKFDLSFEELLGADVWENSRLVSIDGLPARIFSPEHQLSYRLIHDAVAHRYSLLLSRTSRLYLFSLLLQHYAASIDWSRLFADFRRRELDRLLGAYLLYAHRELGLSTPIEWFSPVQKYQIHLAALEQATDCPELLRPAQYRLTLIFLTSHGFISAVRRAFSLFVRAPFRFARQPRMGDPPERSIRFYGEALSECLLQVFTTIRFPVLRLCERLRARIRRSPPAESGPGIA